MSKTKIKHKADAVLGKPDVPRLTYSRREAAAALGCDIQSVDAYISGGKLRASRPLGRVLIRVADVVKMLDENPA